MHVLYPRPPHNILRHPSMPAENLLDSETTWPAFEFLHMPLWLGRWLQVCDGHPKMSSQI